MKSMKLGIPLTLIFLAVGCGPKWQNSSFTDSSPGVATFEDEILEPGANGESEFLESVSVVSDLMSGLADKSLGPWDPKLCNTVFRPGYLFPELRSIDYQGPKNIGRGPSLPFRIRWPLDTETKKDSVVVMRSLSAGHPYHRNARHDGIDFAAKAGAPVRAAFDGEIVHIGWQDASRPTFGYGQFIVLVHRVRESRQQETWITLYGHLQSVNPALKNHQRVRAGQFIGSVGSTGRSTGPHLHFELRNQCEPFNPALRFVPAIEKAHGLAQPSKLQFGA